jgi:DtxR family Mn-dependent transcriptional regulator
MATSTVEDYLKTLYGEQQRAGGELVPMGVLASSMNVTPGTATSMVKALAESGLVDYEPRGGVRLSGKGEKLALHVLRRHRLVELFLVEVLGLDWSEVDQEAEELEHAISDKVLAKIDELLKFPEVDPHGDPIPKPDGSFGAPTTHRSLADCAAGEGFQVSRVIDQSPAFLRFLSSAGLPLGMAGQIISNEREAGTVTIRVADQQTTLGREAAEKIMVQPLARDL